MVFSFFKQKTAYGVRISDWSSDVCSSDLVEEIRPGLRQYLFEDEHEQTPFSRSQRSLVYARAKNEVSDRAFGTLVDVYKNGYEFIAHSTQPAPIADPATFRIKIGGKDCTAPYRATISDERRVGKEWVSRVSSRW